MQTQEDHSNLIPALNVDSLKVDLVAMQNTCSEKEDSNSKTASSKSVKESSLDSATKDVHAIKYKMSKAKERCMAYFRSLHSHLQVLSKEDLKSTRIKHGFKRAFMSLFGQDRSEDADLVVTESSGTESKVQDDSSRSGNDIDADDADIKPIYEEQPMAEVKLTAECNIFAIGQQHTEQPEIINEGRVDQYLEQCQVNSPMLDSSPDNQTTDYLKQSLESENILLKKTVAQFQNDFSRMEAHCIALKLKYQNQALKSGQHGQILNETSNKAKTKKEIDVLETMNIELEHSVAQLRKENETLKKHYKDLYDSIKITRSKTIEQITSLLANNVDLKTQIQEKVFAIAALKNDLRKLKGNSVDTKFDKTSALGKPFASQVDVNNNLSRPVTQHYLPKRRESVFAKPDHVIASSESRNSSKNMPRFSSNDVVHNHYLDEARKKTQERDRNSKTSVTPSARFQITTDGSKPKPRSNNQTPRSLPVSKSSCVTIKVVPKADHSKSSSSFSDSKYLVCSTCHKCVFNANHDACIEKLLKEVNSRAKIQSHKTRNSNKPVDQKVSYSETWIFKSVGLRWIPTVKLFDSCTSKVDSEPPHGSNVDIPNIHECKQTLDVSAGKSQSMVAEKADISETIIKVDSQMMIQKMTWKIYSVLCLMHNSNGENQVVSKSSAVTTADASDKRQQQRDSSSSTSTLATTVTADGNFDLDAPVTITASTATKPCQEDSYELYLITGNSIIGVATMYQITPSPNKKANSSTEQLLLILMKEDYLKRYVWYPDSGYSRHMTKVKQYLHKYSKESGPKVVFGDNSLRKVASLVEVVGTCQESCGESTSAFNARPFMETSRPYFCEQFYQLFTTFTNSYLDTVGGMSIHPIMKCASAIHQLAIVGANNDLNVLHRSNLFDDVLDDLAPECPFTMNGHTYRGYYLAGGIYPTWYAFVKSYSIARTQNDLNFKRAQESARKDIERAFSVLQGR
ncbi:gag-pol polyprotein [Tanacetum coccineum]